MTLRVVVVDDEAVARSRLRRLLGAHADVVIVAEAADGRAAVDAIVTQKPDIVFLDIRMPELDGFEVVAELAPDEMPAIVFVTAFSDHAARAFDTNALDYLLKPYDPDRLAESLNRARDRASRNDSRRILAALDELAREQRALRQAVSSRSDAGGVATGAPPATRRYPDRLLVSKRGHGVFVAAHTITYVESAGNYVRIHVGPDEHRLRIRLTDIEQQLDPSRFARIHRTIIVNISAVAEIQPWFSGDAVVILKDGTRLRLSRHYRGAIESTFGLVRGLGVPDAPG